MNDANKRKDIQIIRKYRPKLLLIPHSEERHPDHVHAHQIVKEAWFYSGLTKIETSLDGKKQKAWRPANYLHYMQMHEFEPTLIVDISDVYEIRRKAVLAFKSQFYDPKSKEPATFLSLKFFLVLLDSRFKYYGQKIGVAYGEPYFSSTVPGVTNLFDLKFFKG